MLLLQKIYGILEKYFKNAIFAHSRTVSFLYAPYDGDSSAIFDSKYW